MLDLFSYYREGRHTLREAGGWGKWPKVSGRLEKILREVEDFHSKKEEGGPGLFETFVGRQTNDIKREGKLNLCDIPLIMLSPYTYRLVQVSGCIFSGIQ